GAEESRDQPPGPAARGADARQGYGPDEHRRNSGPDPRGHPPADGMIAPRRGVLVDSNVLLDIFTEDPTWYDWSAAALAEQAETTVLFVNPLVYAEVSVRFATIEA